VATVNEGAATKVASGYEILHAGVAAKGYDRRFQEDSMAAMKMPRSSIERIYKLTFASVYPLYIQKAENKGRTKEEVDTVIQWLTGYSRDELAIQIEKDNSFEAFFSEAPEINPNASKITGTICGYRVEEIEDELVRKVRYLDKLIDELAKGKPMEKILRK
jgi:hypothetical protein